MFLKSLLLLFVLCEIDGQLQYRPDSRSCSYPRFEHGRFRMRQKSKLIKFMCFPGYSLVGNKYATCRDGQWDVPLPVCVRPGCNDLIVGNGMGMSSHGGAWMMFFCLPNHKLVGFPVVYCDGRRWNGTAPTCVDSREASQLSCTFEDQDLCGWTQDELHDFDWKRLNKKTPSSFLNTGPAFDHTLGAGGYGYYMYIESTSRLENDTARLISPIYESKLSKDGCFSFYYHMFGKTTGGLRVYQKPDNLSMQELLQLMRIDYTNGEKYLIFEKWGNQGNVWYTGVATLLPCDVDFQIVIEGVRGSSFTSDIAIDDVAILQGNNCSLAKNAATTPAVVMPDSCSGRCDIYGTQTILEFGCGCSASCIAEGDCCPDFFDVCIFSDSTKATTDDGLTDDLPQTQKLVASTTIKTTPELRTTKPITTPTHPAIKLPLTSPTTRKPTTTTATPKIVKPTTQMLTTTKKTPTLVFKTSTTLKRYEPTQKVVRPVNVTTKPRVSFKPTTTKAPTTTKSAKQLYADDKTKASKEFLIEVKKSKVETKKSESSGMTIPILVTVGVLFCVGAVLLALWGRGSRGQSALARLRGRVRNDPEVQYLHSAADDE